MARVAGDVADGMIGHPMCSLRWLDEVLVANFELGLSRSGRDRAGLRLPARGLLCDLRRRGGRLRRGAAHDLLLRDRAHLRAALGDARVRRAAAAVGDAFRRGDFAAMPGHVPDEMVDTYCAAGPLDKVRERVEAVAERGDGDLARPADLLPRARADRRVPAADHRGVRPRRVANHLNRSPAGRRRTGPCPESRRWMPVKPRSVESLDDLVGLEHPHPAGALDDRLQRAQR